MPRASKKADEPFVHQRLLGDLPLVGGGPEGIVDGVIAGLGLLGGGDPVVKQGAGEGELLCGVEVEEGVVGVHQKPAVLSHGRTSFWGVGRDCARGA